MMTHRERLRDQRGFVHKSFIGKFVGGIAKKALGSIPIFGGIAEGFIDQFTGTVPGTQAGCPPGFISTPTGCVPRGSPVFNGTGGPITQGLGGALARARARARARAAAAAGAATSTIPGAPIPGPPPGGRADFNGGRPPVPTLAVTGQFGAGFEASIVSREMRLCPPKTVLGVDGVCYNRRDLRNDERAWPRGRRPLLTGGEMRAVSTASAAAKKLQRKQKQLQELGLLPKPQRARRALLPGHRATLTHAGASGHE